MNLLFFISLSLISKILLNLSHEFKSFKKSIMNLFMFIYFGLQVVRKRTNFQIIKYLLNNVN
jgi:hypothetical protein